MKVKPLADRILVKSEKAETKTAGGLYIPDTAQEKTQVGVVVACGPGTEKEKITVKVGDCVMYDKYAGSKIDMQDDNDYLIVRNSDLIAVIEK